MLFSSKTFIGSVLSHEARTKSPMKHDVIKLLIFIFFNYYCCKVNVKTKIQLFLSVKNDIIYFFSHLTKKKVMNLMPYNNYVYFRTEAKKYVNNNVRLETIND